MNEETKYCPDCERHLPHNQFRKCAGRKYGLDTYCKECKTGRDREYRQKLYGKVKETYNTRCAACGEDDPYVLEIDHQDRAEAQRIVWGGSSGHHLHRYILHLRSPDRYHLLCKNCHMKKHRDRVEIDDDRVDAWVEIFENDLWVEDKSIHVDKGGNIIEGESIEPEKEEEDKRFIIPPSGGLH